MPNVILLRHGESTWNRENRFTRWTDVDLTDQGIKERQGDTHEITKLHYDRRSEPSL